MQVTDSRVKTERLPRWKDCGVFVIAGSTVYLILLLSGKSEAASWFGARWGVVAILLALLTAVRQRN